MEKKFILLYSFLLVLFLISIQLAQSQPPVCAWRGYARLNISGTVVYGNTSHVVTSYTNGSQATNGTIESTGYYRINIPGVNGDNITLKICGVNVVQGFQTWSCEAPGYHILNISINTSADGSSCTYACGCSGNYCNSGVCASSPPATTTTTVSESPGGGGGGTTTTIIGTTTTTLPPVKENETIASIPSGGTGNFSFETVPITEIDMYVKNNVSNAQITVTKTDTAPATVSITAPGFTYAYLNIVKTNVADADISKVTIKFKIEKSWITNNNIDVGTITLNRYVNGAWVALTTKLLSSNGYYYFEAESSGLSVFAVSGQKKAVTTTISPTTTVPITTTTILVAPPVPPEIQLPLIFGIIIIILIVLGILFWRRGKKASHIVHHESHVHEPLY
jgi:PGF-pre-PGF domain-containing protein